MFGTIKQLALRKEDAGGRRHSRHPGPRPGRRRLCCQQGRNPAWASFWCRRSSSNF